MATKETTKVINYRTRKAIGTWLTYLVMILLAIFFMFPIVFMLISSIKESELQVVSDMSSIRAFLPVGELGFENYREVISSLNFGQILFNSVFIMLVTVTIGLLINSMIAYALARLRFKGKKFCSAL